MRSIKYRAKAMSGEWVYGNFIHSNVSGSVFGHLMLDIETMGNESFSSIVSIGALEFDIETGELPTHGRADGLGFKGQRSN